MFVVVAGVPGTVAADQPRAGGTVLVAEGETVGDLSALGASVIVRGTVDGDVSAAAGSVTVAETGRVTGYLSGAASKVTIDGRVDGDVSVGTAHLRVGPAGVVGGDLSVGADTVRIEGRIAGNAELGAARITLAETAVVDGNVRYDRDASFTRENGAVVGGSVEVVRSVSGWAGFALFVIPWWVGVVYATLASLAFGAILLVVALTIVGISLTILGAVLFGFVAWAGLVYGRFAVAAYVLGRFDVENRWAALVVGVVGLALVGTVPILGGIVDGMVALLGLGAIAMLVFSLWRRRKYAVDEPVVSGVEGDAPAA